MLSLKLFLLILPLIIFPQVSPQPYNTLVAAIKKDEATSLYTITLNSHQHYVIDLTASFSWVNCSLLPQVPPVACHSLPCAEAQSYPSLPPCASQPTAFAPSLQPSASQNPGSAPAPSPTSLLPCTNCSVTPVNPVAKSCAAGSPLTYTSIHLHRTDGLHFKTRTTVSHFYVSCAPTKLFRSLPNHASGLASFSSSPLSFSSQFAKKFAMCLPSSYASGTPGVSFFGDGPYYFLMHYPAYNLDIEPMLSYTPLLTKPNSPDFFIGVNSIGVSGRYFPVSETPIKLSTVLPYTTLRTDVYKWLKRWYRNGTGIAGVPLVKRVKPFGLCWDVGMIRTSRDGWAVLDIDLDLGNGATWTIVGANSLKVIGNAACLAFVNGGDFNGGSAMVIGSYQMEDTLLVFDMEKSRLGFSPNLTTQRTACATFDFTTIPSPSVPN